MTASGAALLVIDMQVDVVEHAHDLDAVVANINSLIAKARDAGAPVIWVQHADEDLPKDTPGWQYIPDLVRLDDEPLVHKYYRSSFDDTDLEAILREHDVGHVIVTGAQTEFCVRNTLHGALAHGFDATLVTDAHTTDDLRPHSPAAPGDVIAHTNLTWRGTSRPGAAGHATPASEIEFSA